MKSKIYKKNTANKKKSSLGYLDKSVDEHSNTYHHSIGKKPFDTQYSTLAEKVEANSKLSKFKVGYRVPF